MSRLTTFMLTTFRDYSVNTQKNTIQICFFIGYLEIHSPSEFYRRMTVEDLGKAKPDLRNPTLATMSEFLLNTENRYSGIPTIRREMKEHNLLEPLFENRRNEFIITLYNHSISSLFVKHLEQDKKLENY